IGAVAAEGERDAAHASRPLGGAQDLEIRRLPDPRGDEIAERHVAEIVGDDAAGVVRPAERTTEADPAAHVLSIVEIEVAPGVEDIEADGERRVPKPRLRKRKLEVVSPPAAFQSDVHALPVPEQVVVPQLDESGQPRLARVPRARARRAGLLFLHLERQIDVRAVPRGLVIYVHVLEKPEPENVAL